MLKRLALRFSLHCHQLLYWRSSTDFVHPMMKTPPVVDRWKVWWKRLKRCWLAQTRLQSWAERRRLRHWNRKHSFKVEYLWSRSKSCWTFWKNFKIVPPNRRNATVLLKLEHCGIEKNANVPQCLNARLNRCSFTSLHLCNFGVRKAGKLQQQKMLGSSKATTHNKFTSGGCGNGIGGGGTAPWKGG